MKPTEPARRPSPSVHVNDPTCQLRPPAGPNEQPAFACAHIRTRQHELSLSGGGAARALTARARCAALIGVDSWSLKANCAIETALSLGARPCSGVPAADSNVQPAFACALTQTRQHALSLRRGRSTRAYGARARRRALVGDGLCSMRAHCASETALSLGARPCSDALAMAPNEQPAFACAHTRTRQHELSLGRRRSTRTYGAHALRRAGWSRLMAFESQLCHRDGRLPRCEAVLRRASHGLQRAAGVRVCAHANAPARALSRKEA